MAKFDLNQSMKEAEETNQISKNTPDESFKIQEGDNRIRLMSPIIIYPQHYIQGGYSGPCLGKDIGCPGCLEDDKRKALKDEDPEKYKKLTYTKSVKWLGWVLDYRDNEIKLGFLPHKVAVQLQALQNNPEYAFEEAPMPYDVTINAKDAGKTTVAYTVTPARNNTLLPENILVKMEKKHAPEVIKGKIREKRARELGLIEKEVETTVDYPESAGDPNFDI